MRIGDRKGIRWRPAIGLASVLVVASSPGACGNSGDESPAPTPDAAYIDISDLPDVRVYSGCEGVACGQSCGHGSACNDAGECVYAGTLPRNAGGAGGADGCPETQPDGVPCTEEGLVCLYLAPSCPPGYEWTTASVCFCGMWVSDGVDCHPI